MSRREQNIAPYTKHMIGILGPIEKYHSKDSWLQNSSRSLKKWRGGGGGGSAPSKSVVPPLNPPMNKNRKSFSLPMFLFKAGCKS